MEPRDMKDLKLCAVDLSVEDALILIGDYVVSGMSEREKPGIVAALRCIVHMEDMDAEDVVVELVAWAKREEDLASISQWLRSEQVYRVEYDQIPRGPYFGPVVYVEAASVRDAASAPSDGHSTIVSVRRASDDDVEEVWEISKREGH